MTIGIKIQELQSGSIIILGRHTYCFPSDDYGYGDVYVENKKSFLHNNRDKKFDYWDDFFESLELPILLAIAFVIEIIITGISFIAAIIGSWSDAGIFMGLVILIVGNVSFYYLFNTFISDSLQMSCIRKKLRKCEEHQDFETAVNIVRQYS